MKFNKVLLVLLVVFTLMLSSCDFIFNLLGIDEDEDSIDGINVALTASVEVSALGPTYSGHTPANAGVIDCTTSDPGNFWTGEAFSDTGYVILTLDDTYKLSKIRIYSQYWSVATYGTEAYIKYEVKISTNKTDWTTVRSDGYAQNSVDLGADGEWAREELAFTERDVKYIKINITDSTGPSGHLWRTSILEIIAGNDSVPTYTWE